MTTDPDPRPGLAGLTGPITSLVGAVLVVVGFLAEQSSSGVSGGSGLPLYVLGTLAVCVGVCWSVVMSVVALAGLLRRNDRGRWAALTLHANAPVSIGIALVVLVVWLANAS